MRDAPIIAKHLIKMNALADLLKGEFEGDGFVLLVFNFGEGGTMNYISNAKREDVVAAMKEFIVRQESQ